MIKILFQEKAGGNLFYKQENMDTTEIRLNPNHIPHPNPNHISPVISL
jgi:hypothetical protein